MQYKSKKLVSVLMPAYNAQKFISSAITSILNQSYSNWELLIADDASTDNTRNIIDLFSDNRIYRYTNKKNIGYLRTWNNLIEKAKGDYITFLDADDTCQVERLELMVSYLETHPQVGICGSNYNRINELGEIIETSNFPLEYDEIKKGFPENYNFIGSAVMIRRDVYEEIGGYNVFFDRMGMEDIYWIYLILEKYSMVNLPQTLYNYRYNPRSVSGNLSDNPSKLNSKQIVSFLIEQREKTGSDWLSDGKTDLLIKKLKDLNSPFEKDKSYYYYFIAKRRFYEGRKKESLHYMKKAIKEDPLKLKYYRDYLYFCRN